MTPSREKQQDPATSDLGLGGWRGSEKAAREGQFLQEEVTAERGQEVGQRKVQATSAILSWYSRGTEGGLGKPTGA